jgi:hypothetical protein
VDELRARGELGELAGHAVVETGADGHDQVRLVHRIVRRTGAVHPGHAEPLLVVGREGAQPHQRAGDREAVGRAELAELLGGIRIHDAAAAVDHGSACVRERLCGKADLLEVAVRGRLVAGQVDARHRLVRDVGARQILRDVHQHRTGSPGARHVERLVDRVRDLARVLDHDRVLHDRHRDAGDVGLLKAVRADQVGAHLSCEEDGRHAVHHGVGDRGHQVGGAGTARGERNSDLPRRLRVALRSMAGALLVTALDVPQAGVVERVVGGQVRAARNAEYMVHALGLEAFHDGVDGSHDGAGPFGVEVATGRAASEKASLTVAFRAHSGFPAAPAASGKCRSAPQRMQT